MGGMEIHREETNVFVAKMYGRVNKKREGTEAGTSNATSFMDDVWTSQSAPLPCELRTRMA